MYQQCPDCGEVVLEVGQPPFQVDIAHGSKSKLSHWASEAGHEKYASQAIVLLVIIICCSSS